MTPCQLPQNFQLYKALKLETIYNTREASNEHIIQNAIFRSTNTVAKYSIDASLGICRVLVAGHEMVGAVHQRFGMACSSYRSKICQIQMRTRLRLARGKLVSVFKFCLARLNCV